MSAKRKRQRASSRLSHVDDRGRIRMVDVSAKPETAREAVAECLVLMSREAVAAIQRRAVKKGDPLQSARLAGIMAAKRTADLIPLCHQIPLSQVDVEIRVGKRGCRIRSRATTVARTGVEMEAMVAVLVAGLTMYDMLKAIDRTMVVGPARLIEKRGGRSGHYRRRT